jgi:hypothetical protein
MVRTVPFISATSVSPSTGCHPERSRAIRESGWHGEVEGPLPSPNAVPGIGVPRSARDDKPKEVSANRAASAVKDVDVFRQLVQAGGCPPSRAVREGGATTLGARCLYSRRKLRAFVTIGLGLCSPQNCRHNDLLRANGIFALFSPRRNSPVFWDLAAP